MSLPFTVTLQSFLFLFGSFSAKFSLELLGVFVGEVLVESLRWWEVGGELLKGAPSTSSKDLTDPFFFSGSGLMGLGGGVRGSTVLLEVRVRCVTLTGWFGVVDARSNESILGEMGRVSGVLGSNVADGSLIRGGVVSTTTGTSPLPCVPSCVPTIVVPPIMLVQISLL